MQGRILTCEFCDNEFKRVVWHKSHSCDKKRRFMKRVAHLLPPETELREPRPRYNKKPNVSYNEHKGA